MAETEDEAVEEITRAIAEGREIDWGAWSDRGLLSESALESLRVLAAMRLSTEAGGASAESAPLETGFEGIEEVGRGAHGRVWRAIDRALERPVALKVLRGQGAIAPEARARFVKEARLLAAVDCAHVVKVHAIDEWEGRLRISLEWIDGSTLDQVVRDSGTLPPEEAARVGVDLCRALTELHRRGIVHRDLKPANVMRAEGGRIVLLDFGIARELAPDGEHELEAGSGTPLYMAPEQWVAGGEQGPHTDLYALGVLLYWLVSGRHPFEAETAPELREAVLEGRPRLLVDHLPDAPPAFDELVSRALAREPEDRQPSAGAMEGELRRFLGEAEEPAAPAGRRLWLGAAAAVLLFAALAWLAPEWLGPASPVALELEAELYALRTGEKVRLADGDAVHPGDRLFMDVRCSREAWVYVFNEDREGRLYTLFPLTGFDLANPLPARPAGERVCLPGPHGGEDHHWKVDSEGGGGESVLVVAAIGPVEAAESLRDQIQEASPFSDLLGGAQTLATLGEGVRRDVLRSIGGVRPAGAAEEPPGREGPTPRLGELAERLGDGPARGGEVFWRALELRNAPR